MIFHLLFCLIFGQSGNDRMRFGIKNQTSLFFLRSPFIIFAVNKQRMEAKILVIDDNMAVLKTLQLVLKEAFSKVVAVNNPQLLPSLLSKGDVDAVLLDMNFCSHNLDGAEGLFWLERIKQRSNLAAPPAVILITAFGEVALAVESLKLGADDFIQKPWDNDRLIEVITDAVEKRRAAINNTAAKDKSDDTALAKSYIHSLIKKYAINFMRSEPQPTDDAMAMLVDIAKAGEFNLLEESIERTMMLCGEAIWDRECIIIAEKSKNRTILTLEEMEKQFIQRILGEVDHNLAMAARQLGISRQTLYNKMNKYGIV